jgi:hypothetical protein
LTVSNTLAQQQAIQSQIAAAQASAVAPASTTDSATAQTETAAKNPAAALISGNATLTSDLLSVLLNEQSNASASGGGGGSLTLAGMLDQQSQAEAQSQDPFNQLTQSAGSTGNVMDGLQSLLNQLSI